MGRFIGKIVVIMGLGWCKGLGEVIVKCLVEDGVNIVIFDIGELCDEVIGVEYIGLIDEMELIVVEM